MEEPMITYKGEVVPSPDPDFPFTAMITDDEGEVVGDFPVRTLADGEAKVAEVLTELRRLATEETSNA